MRLQKLAKPIIAGVVAWVSALSGAALYIAPLHWARASDLVTMAVWSVPFSMSIVLVATGFLRYFRDRSSVLIYVSAVLLGPSLGFACFMFAAAIQGAWRVAFPVFSCWAFGGLVGLIVLPPTLGRSWYPAFLITVVGLALLLWTHAVLRQLG